MAYYGIHQAERLVSMGRQFLAAEADDKNAAARDKLVEEGWNDEQQAQGQQLVTEGAEILAAKKGSAGSSTESTKAQAVAEQELADALSRRLKKTRAKLQADPKLQPLLAILNEAVHLDSRSLASQESRADAFLHCISEPHELPGLDAPQSIREAAAVKPAQEQQIADLLDTFRRSVATQNRNLGQRMELTAEKEAIFRTLDRWLAKWQQIAKADFSDSELVAFGIPYNDAKARRRGRKTKPTGDQEQPA